MASETKVDPADMQYLFQHIGNKGIQAGSILGTFASIPVTAFLHTRRGGYLDAEFAPKAMKAINRTTLPVTALALLAGMGLVGQKEGFDAEKIKDRVYKLENNKQQNRCDHFAYGGAVIGSALSCLRGLRLRNFAGCAFLGTTAGVLMHVATSQEDEGSKVEALKKSADNMAKELS